MKRCSFFSFFLFLLWISLESAQERPTQPYLRGVVLVDSASKIHKEGLTNVRGFLAREEVEIPGGIELLKKQLESHFLGKPITTELLMSLRSQLLKYYKERDHALVTIKLPLQDFSNGIIQLIVEDDFLIEQQKPAAFGLEEETDEIPQKEAVTPKQKACLTSKPLMPHLTTLVLINPEDVGKPFDLNGKTGIYFHDIIGPSWHKRHGNKRFAKVLEPFLFECLTQELIQTIKKTIVCYYRDHHHPVVTVYVPEQDITDGTLYLVVLDGKLGNITASGNYYSRSALYLKQMRLYPGDPIDTDILLTDIAWLNRSPFRKVDVRLKPGDAFGITDIELDIQDRYPFQVYAGTDNTGTEPTGDVRWFAGVTWGNAFFLDHILTYQYTSSVDLNKFKAHTFHYTVPIPIYRHILRFFGGYATVHPDIADELHSTGHNTQGSVRYTIPFGTNYQGALQEITFGADFKNTDNNLVFVGEDDIALITKTVNLTQFVCGYALGRENAYRKFSANFDLYFSPATFLPNQTDADFSNLSPHAKSKYVYGRLGIAETWQLPKKFALFLQGRFQLSNQVLLQSEQFGLGGYDTVRGYEEREFNADNALCTNVEIHTPPVSVVRFFSPCSQLNDRLYFLVFFDYGLGNVNHRGEFINLENFNAKIPRFEYLMSVGPGFRYTINSYLSARLDWGVKLHRTPFSDGARSKFHFGFILNY